MRKFKISIRKGAFLVLLFVAIFSIISITTLWVITEIFRSDETIEKYKETLEEEQKKFLKGQVIKIIELIDYSRNHSTKSKKVIQKDILEYVSKIRLKYGGYIFINTYAGKALIFDGVKIIGEKDIRNMTDPDGLRLFDIEMECAKNPEGDFFSYKFKRLDTFKPVPKLSYATGYDDWEWIIGAGIYLDDTTVFLENQKNEYQAILYKKILYIILLLVVLIMILFYVSSVLTSFISKEFQVFEEFFKTEPKSRTYIDQNNLQINEFKRLAHSVNIMIQNKQVAEKIIKQERDKANDYLNVAGVIILALNKEGIVTLINKKGCETLECDSSEIIGKNWFNHFIPISEKQELQNKFLKVMNGEIDGFENGENKIISKKGKERIILWQTTTIYDNDNKISGSLSSGLDLTKAKKVETDYIESEEKYKILFENTTDPVLIIGEKNTFIDCNQSALNILGIKTKRQLIDRHPSSLSPEYQPDGKLSLTKAQEKIDLARKEGFAIFEWNHINNKNEVFVVDVSLTQIPISGIKYLYVVWRDITERKKQEEELKIAKEAAEQSDLIKTSFLHNMQHEIRTPLNAIMGFTQLLKQQNITGEERTDYYDDILNSGTRLINIIDKIIDYARLQAGYITLNYEVIELKQLLNNIYRRYNSEIKSKNISFSINAINNNCHPVIQTDVIKVNEIISHLIDNAIKFTEKGKISVEYNIIDDKVVFSIIDTGIGISESEITTIFEKFNRITHKQTEKLYGGNGLGLSISKAILEFIGGEISVESKTGKGSVFSFSIPYKPYSKEKLLSYHKDKNKTIVIVSNTPKKIELLTKVIAQIANVKIIKNSFEAVEYFQNDLPSDLLVIDFVLKDMTGSTLCKAIKAFNKNLSIIAYLNSDSAASKEEILCSGFNDYLDWKNTENEIISSMLMYLIDNTKKIRF